MLDLRKNNAIAVKEIKKRLKTTNRTCVIKPVGTGKSYIALALLERYTNSLYVTSYKTVLEDFKKLAEELIPSADAEYRIYSTINSDEFKDLNLIIFDELHRIGAPEWSKKIDLLVNSNPDAKIVGLTATPIRHLDNERNMADEFFFGNVAFEQSLKEAIVEGELPMPQYISSIYSFKDRVARLEKKMQGRGDLKGQLEKAKRAIEEADGLRELFEKNLKVRDGKYIVFCSSLEHLNQMVEESKEWFSWLPEVHRYELYSLQGDLKGYEAFKADESSALKLLFSIDMITEGVHPEKISGEIMLRPTASMNVFEQQLGRCLSVRGDETPQVFDIVNNASSLRQARHMIKDIAKAVVEKEDKPAEEAEKYYTIRQQDEDILILCVIACKDLNFKLKQVNSGFSIKPYTLRGLHYQDDIHAQAKLVYCLTGSIFSVALDLRKDSSSYGSFVACVLSAENHKAMYIPRGYAHGYLTLEPNTFMQWCVDNNFCKEAMRCVRWDSCGVNWPGDPADYIINERDANAPAFVPVVSEDIY